MNTNTLLKDRRGRIAHVDLKMLVKLVAQNKVVCHAQPRWLHWMICTIVDFLKLACDLGQSTLPCSGKELPKFTAHSLS